MSNRTHTMARRAKRGTAAALLVCLLATLVVAAAPAYAADGSVVFVKDFNVWIMPGVDAGQSRAVTTDGTAAEPYTIAQQDDSGRIVAVLSGADGIDRLVRLDHGGNLLSGPFRPHGAFATIANLGVSAAGDLVAYSSQGPCDGQPVGDSAFDYCEGVDFAYADGREQSVGTFLAGAGGPSWFAPDHVVVSYTPADSAYAVGVSTYRIGEADARDWLDTCPGFVGPDDSQFICHVAFDPTITTGHDRLVYAVRSDDSDGTPAHLRVHTLAGPPPAAPSFACRHDGPPPAEFGDASNGEFGHLSWSPDGDALMWELGAPDGTAPPGAGIYLATGFNSRSCQEAFATTRLLVAGGSSPHWGPASVGAAAPAPDDPGTPNGDGSSGDAGTPGADGPTGGGLADGDRVDGGGQADPVGQAIATSRVLFADGTVDRVVLATADRFPDALAGSALAGSRGAILLTAGLGDLDARVTQEIARVTGGRGVVLTLGGTAAVSEQAAEQARRAAGDLPCQAPLPSSCRYAGAAREQTAALISATVLAEQPGAVALVARRDDFADAITGGAYAARAGVPILLTSSTELHPDTEEFLRQQGIGEVVVLGGTAAISDATYQALPGTKRRVAGSERTATAVAVAEQLWAPAGLGHGGALLVNVRHPNGWQTALTAAVASAIVDAPQLGVENPPTGLSGPTRGYLQGRNIGVAAFGDPALVSDAQLEEAVQTSG